VLNQWGYDMVKLDFLYAVCMIPRNNKSRGQLMWEAMSFVRDCVGEKYILGCGVPLASCFGLVDFCRIGCDVGLDWDDRWYMRLFHRERISTRHAIGSAIGRRHLNSRAFVNDPDVFMLRDTNTALTKNQKETLALTNLLFGGLLFTSDDVSKYTPHQQALYQSIMNSNKPVITSVLSKKDIIYVEVASGEQFIINLSSKSRKESQTGRVLKPYESVWGQL
jgi:alpha-galactosidase